MTIDIETLHLAHGSHADRGDGVCLLEAVAWIAGEPHTDHPVCVSPALAAFGRSLNDVLPDDKRQQLRQFIPLLPGTAGDGHDETRGYMALDWLIRDSAPAWFDLAGLTAEAQTLRDLPRIVDLDAARAAAWAAADAAWAVADAAGDARAAAGDARAAAWDARAAAWDARAAAWAVADAAGDARAAAWAAADAAWAAWAPTAAALQDSAITLYRAMINPGGD
jgi:hypothetical protein